MIASTHPGHKQEVCTREASIFVSNLKSGICRGANVPVTNETAFAKILQCLMNPCCLLKNPGCPKDGRGRDTALILVAVVLSGLVPNPC